MYMLAFWGFVNCVGTALTRYMQWRLKSYSATKNEEFTDDMAAMTQRTRPSLEPSSASSQYQAEPQSTTLEGYPDVNAPDDAWLAWIDSMKDLRRDFVRVALDSSESSSESRRIAVDQAVR